MENIIVVGTGDYYSRFLAPCLEILQQQKLVKVLTSIDIKENDERKYLKEVPHKIRQPSQELNEIISDFASMDPIIILGHANNFHLPDAEKIVLKGFRVMIEKPYAINHEEIKNLESLIKKYPEKIFLLDYYLMRKFAPLALLIGVIKKDSFYVTTEEVLRKKEIFKEGIKFPKPLKEFIGDVLSIKIEILESFASTGKLNHRGEHLFDTRTGGGMIQDLGLHALSAISILKDSVGQLDTSFEDGSVKIAQCKEYCNMADQIHQIPEKYIAETYAEINLKTSKNIPIEITIGKYTKEEEDKKNLIISGTKGKIVVNLEENFLTIYSGNTPCDKIELINARQRRYYPVIRSALEFFSGNNPFTFNSVEELFKIQKLILNIVEKARRIHAIGIYNQGKSALNIFNKESRLEQLSKLNKNDFKSYFNEYSNYLYSLIKGIDRENLNQIVDIFLNTRRNGNTIYFVGNGGSAATASHFAQDLAEVGQKVGCKIFNCLSLTDNVPAITASANDYGYDKIFTSQMQGIFKKGDILVAISASGNSKNVLEAAKLAKEKGGTIIGLVGFDGGELLHLSDYTLNANAERGEYGPVEDIHIIFNHLLTSFFYYKLRGEINYE